jgi:hypothetical protein
MQVFKEATTIRFTGNRLEAFIPRVRCCSLLAPWGMGCLPFFMSKPFPTIIPGLRSPSEMVGGIVYFGRMLDKIRLHAKGELPEDWATMVGDSHAGSFDSRCCSFLRIDYADLAAETLKGGSDDEMLEWAFAKGNKPSAEEIEVWNGFMMKRGWRDSASQRVKERLREIGLEPGTVETMFEFIDLDEGRR